MIESRKKAVSIRVNSADVRKMKKLAQRLGVRDSDVVRFAVKCLLARLGPLCDAEVKGRSLVPVFVESGVELLRYFELDAARLEAIINDGVDPVRRVDRDDIALIALTGTEEPYAALMLRDLYRGDQAPRSRTGELSDSLRRYLYEKYAYGTGVEESSVGDDEAQAIESHSVALLGGRHD